MTKSKKQNTAKTTGSITKKINIDTVDVFVYGTLKKGGYFSKSFDSVRERSVPSRIKGTLFNIGNGEFPGVVLNNENEVVGELHTYRERKDVLKLMDHIEGVEQKLFKREMTSVKLENNEIKEAIIYTFNQSTDDFEIIKDGVWKIEEE